jgi:hypothetical protein
VLFGCRLLWRNYCLQQLKLHCVNEFRQTEIQTGEPIVPYPSSSEFELAIEKLKSHKSAGIDQISVEMFKQEV